MDMDQHRKDLILNQNEYAFIQDGSSGVVQVIVGPSKKSLAENDTPIHYTHGHLEECSFNQSRKQFITAKEGQYVILSNPVAEDYNIHPAKGQHDTPKLAFGSGVNIPGPCKFALYPEQHTQVVAGHILRSNQYLVVRVTNHEQAAKNWHQTVAKSADGGDVTDEELMKSAPPKLATGQLLIIKGTDVSFYIPPTGLEVVASSTDGQYVRNAITLEQLEYCVLLDENGTKKYVRGPDVVFPGPTQKFLEDKNGLRKFRAYELDDRKGVYVKVIKSYKEGNKNVEEGEELFISGKQQKIYFPREEHSIIRYSGNDKHYAIAIPRGEGRYVLDRNSGEIELITGPKMELLDPRDKVVVKRVINPNIIQLMYPGNKEAYEFNASQSPESETQAVYAGNVSAATKSQAALRKVMAFADTVEMDMQNRWHSEEAGSSMLADAFDRSTSYTAPRTVELNTKYDGAVSMNIWTGYAVKLTNKEGKSRVVEGPRTVLLDYDETPEVFDLSRGNPKGSRPTKQDVYLCIKSNIVNDTISAKTKDFVAVQIPVSFKVNFIGDSSKWFNVRNYVSFLTTAMRSKVIQHVKQYGIEELDSDYEQIIRDCILEDEKEGYTFEENGMCIYDLELSTLDIMDDDLNEALRNNKREVVTHSIKLQTSTRRLELTKQLQKLRREELEENSATSIKELAIMDAEDQISKENELKRQQRQADIEEERHQHAVAIQEFINAVQEHQLNRDKLEKAQQLEHETAVTNLQKAVVEFETEATVKKAQAVNDKLAAALEQFADKDLRARLAESLNATRILKDPQLGKAFKQLLGESMRAPDLRIESSETNQK